MAVMLPSKRNSNCRSIPGYVSTTNPKPCRHEHTTTLSSVHVMMALFTQTLPRKYIRNPGRSPSPHRQTLRPVNDWPLQGHTHTHRGRRNSTNDCVTTTPCTVCVRARRERLSFPWLLERREMPEEEKDGCDRRRGSTHTHGRMCVERERDWERREGSCANSPLTAAEQQQDPASRAGDERPRNAVQAGTAQHGHRRTIHI